jgi:hypothetical protein
VHDRVSRLGLVVPALVALLLGCGGHRDTLPAALIGTWTTSDAAYEGRYLKLGERTLELGLGGRDFELLPIRGVDAEDLADASTFYSVEYGQSAEDALTLRFHFRPGPPGILKIEHEPQIWTRQERRPPAGGISG